MTIDFDEMFQNNKKELILQSAKRVKTILETENIEYEMDDLKYLVRHYYPSNRNILGKIQQLSQGGHLTIDRSTIDVDIVNDQIINGILENDFEKVRVNVAKMPDPGTLFLTLFENIKKFKTTHRPEIIILIAKYQSYDAHVRDRMVNSTAAAVEIMQTINDK